MSRHPYRDKTAVLTTMHEKLALIAPAMLTTIGLEIRGIVLDTDRLGTFAGDIARQGTQWDTAVSKARLGMAFTGSNLGLASEGSVGPLAAMPFVTGTVELVVLVDDTLGIVVGETAIDYTVATVAADIAPGDDMSDMLQRGRFPDHGMIVRPACGPTSPLHKGIHNLEVLDRAIRECALASADRRARVETDLRAHHCPTRRPVIQRAASRLAARLAARCPSCATPGWGVVRVELGVPCGHCGYPVPIPNADVSGCVACTTEHAKDRTYLAYADPGQCEQCNP